MLSALRLYFLLQPFLLVSLAWFLLAPSETTATKVPFDAQPAKQFAKDQSEIVFIGNSMLKTRIDEVLFEKISNKKATLFKPGGGYSALWYLILKNWVLDSSEHLDVVFIFFRSTTLTEPEWRTDGRYQGLIEKVSHESEPEYHEVLGEKLSWQEEIHSIIENRFHTNALKESFDRWLRDFSFRMSRLQPVKEKRHSAVFEEFTTRLNSKFDFRYIRRDTFAGIETVKEQEATVLETGAQNFQRKFSKSFLPYMIQLAKKRNLRLAFIQVRSRNLDTLPEEKREFFESYAEALKRYLESEGQFFYSFQHDPKITTEWYGNGDHISDECRPRWTEHFYSRMKDVLPALKEQNDLS